MDKLTDKQKLFCEEYLVDFNGTQAAIRAGYSRKAARQIAAENLSKPSISNYLDERINSKIKNAADRQELMETCTKILRGQIKRQELVKGEVYELEPKVSDKLKAAEALMRVYGMFRDNVNITTPEPLFINVDYGEDEPGAAEPLSAFAQNTTILYGEDQIED